MTSLDDFTAYLDAQNVTKYLNDRWTDLVLCIENALKSYSARKVIQPVRAAVPVEKHKGILLAMPAYNEEDDSMATKIVTLYPENKKCNLPSIHASILLHDTKNGRLKAILDGDIITKMRTAAASVVASKILIWNVNKESALIMSEEIKQDGLTCVVCDDVESTVKDADIIITVTVATKPILKKQWVKDGAHINAVGAPIPEWQELDNDLLLSSVVYVDSIEGALAESGDIIQSKAPIYAEIGEVILGSKEAFPEKTTIFKSLGMAVEDVAAAELVYQNYMASKK